MTIPSYPKVYAFGHAAIPNLTDLPDGATLVIQEKYDGSQISFGWDDDGELYVRSKGKLQYGDGAVPDKMFNPAVTYLSTLEPHALGLEWYRGEFFSKPKHNTLAYPRMPKNGIVLYDVNSTTGPENYFGKQRVKDAADALGLEACQEFGSYTTVTRELIDELMKKESSLGGPMEGIVIKNYHQFSKDGKVTMGKVVSDEFREKHEKSWKQRNPSGKDVIQDIITSLDTEARYEKAYQHLRDNGKLTGTPKDIGALMAEVKRDTLEEEADWILAQLQKYAIGKIGRGLGRGVPDWYKNKLLEDALV